MCRIVKYAVSKSKIPKPKTRMGQLYSRKYYGLLYPYFLTLDKSSATMEYVHILTDAFSKFSKAIATKDKTAETVAKVLIDHWFNVYGIPERIHRYYG